MIKILKIEMQEHRSGYVALRVTAQTDISVSVPIDMVLKDINQELAKYNAFAPDNMLAKDILNAYHQMGSIDSWTLHDNANIAAAYQWLCETEGKNVIVEVDEVFANTKSDMWFVSYWTLDLSHSYVGMKVN